VIVDVAALFFCYLPRSAVVVIQMRWCVVPIQKPKVNIKNLNQKPERSVNTPVIVRDAHAEIIKAIAIIGDLLP